MLAELLRNQITLGDLILLLRRVTAQEYELHAVAKRAGNRSHIVRRRNEDDLAQIDVEVEIVVPKCIVLLRIENLQQHRCRVAPHASAHFVDFVEHHDRIHLLCIDKPLDNTTRHRTDIGTAVSAQFVDILETAKGDAHEFALQRLGNGVGKRRLSDTGRTCEAENRPLDLSIGHTAQFCQFANRKVFDDPLFRFFESVMVFVELFLDIVDFQVLLRQLAERNLENPVEPSLDHIGIGGIGMHSREPFDLLFDLFEGILVHIGLFGLEFLVILLDLLFPLRVGPELLLDLLELLFEEILFVDLLDAVVDFGANLFLKLARLDLGTDDVNEKQKPLLHILFDEEFVRFRLFDLDCTRNQIGDPVGLVILFDRSDQIGRKLVRNLGELPQLFAKHLHQCIEFQLAVGFGVNHIHLRDQRRAVDLLDDASPCQPLEQNFDTPVGKCHLPHDRTDDTGIVDRIETAFTLIPRFGRADHNERIGFNRLDSRLDILFVT